MQILNLMLSYIKCVLDFILFLWLSSQFFIHRDRKRHLIYYSSLPVLALILFLVNRFHIPQLNSAASLICAATINFIFFKASITAILLCSAMEILLIVICEFMPIFFYTLVFQVDIVTVTYETIRNSAFSLISTGIFCIFIILVRQILTLKGEDEHDLAINNLLRPCLSARVA